MAAAGTPVHRADSTASLGTLGRRESALFNMHVDHSKDLAGIDTLEALFAATLPDKEAFFAGWLSALAAPSVCITSIHDVRRLDNEDISNLPVPPLAKSVFREVVNQHLSSASSQEVALKSTAARAKAFLGPQRDRNMQPRMAGSKYFEEAQNYKLILTREEIDVGVRIVAERLQSWCKGERIVLVGILKGAFMFMSDLCRALERPYKVEFIEGSSYGDKRVQGDKVALSGPPIQASKYIDPITGVPHKVVLVDELMDNGKTMHDIKQYFLTTLSATHKDKDILTVCLFSKTRARQWPDADIIGIPNVPDLWLIGYGLDDRGTKRGWTELFALPKVKIVETNDQDEVQRLLDKLDDKGVLNEPYVFAGHSLTQKQIRFKVNGLDVTEGLKGEMPAYHGSEPTSKVQDKASLMEILERQPVLKDKYEYPLKFCFIAEDFPLVDEDDIFQGNYNTYARMRVGLTKQISRDARRVGVEQPLEPL